MNAFLLISLTGLTDKGIFERNMVAERWPNWIACRPYMVIRVIGINSLRIFYLHRINFNGAFYFIQFAK